MRAWELTPGTLDFFHFCCFNPLITSYFLTSALLDLEDSLQREHPHPLIADAFYAFGEEDGDQQKGLIASVRGTQEAGRGKETWAL